MVEMLQCPIGHDLQLAHRFSPGVCDGCNSDIAREDSIHRCQECDFDLCAHCAKKQATFFAKRLLSF